MAKLPRITDALTPELTEQVQSMDLSNTVIVGEFGEARQNELAPVRNMKEAFATYEPSVEVDVTSVKGDKVNEQIRFKEIKDFEVERVIPQSEALTELSATVDVYADLKAQLAKSPRWKKLFEDPDSRAGVTEMLNQILEILDPDGKTKDEEEA